VSSCESKYFIQSCLDLLAASKIQTFCYFFTGSLLSAFRQIKLHVHSSMVMNSLGYGGSKYSRLETSTGSAGYRAVVRNMVLYIRLTWTQILIPQPNKAKL
jgi:hypothetical protein